MTRRSIDSGSSKKLASKMGLQKRLEIIMALGQELLREVAALQTEIAKVTCDGVTQEVVREIDLAKVVESYEADLIRIALIRTSGRQRQAARLLNVKTSTLNGKIKRYGILESMSAIPQSRA